jgi:hypothetical protein
MTWHPLPHGLRQRTRNGKIARLPEAVRERINTMIEDGFPYLDIIKALSQPGGPPLPYPISEMNLSNWRKGGHQEWRRHQQRLELERRHPFPVPQVSDSAHAPLSLSQFRGSRSSPLPLRG